MTTLVQSELEQVVSSEGIGAASQGSEATSVLYHEQIQSLGQQVFFNKIAPVRHIGVTAVESSTEIAHLCFDVALVLANEGRYDIGLIDASPVSLPLETRLALAPSARTDSAWSIAPHLWFVPRRNWMPLGGVLTEQSTAHLRELAAEFDFSILHCPPLSWLTARIGGACDGLVLVLTAHKTRRLAARRIKDQIQKTRIPLLGTVLRERRLPIPEALYHSL